MRVGVIFCQSTRGIRIKSPQILRYKRSPDLCRRKKIGQSTLHLESLLTGLFRRYVAGNRQNTASPILRTIRNLLQQRHGGPLSVDELARSCHYSSGHLSELLYRKCGIRAKQLINRERTVIAASFLEFSEMNISEIAEYMGFPKVFAFSAFFRHHTGLPPSSYRYGKRNELPGDTGSANQK